MVWRRTVESSYLPDSFYRYHESWFHLRQDALYVVKALSKGLQRVLTNRQFDFHAAFEHGELPGRMTNRLNRSPDPPDQTPEDQKAELKEASQKWKSSFGNFFRQLLIYAEDRSNQHAGSLAINNFKDAVDRLLPMHDALGRLTSTAADYFDATSLDQQEREEYTRLGELLEIWILDPPRTSYRDIWQYAKIRRDRDRNRMLSLVSQIVAPLAAQGIDVTIPSDVHFQHPLRHLSIAFTVQNPCSIDPELDLLINALGSVEEAADFFWLAPLFEGRRAVAGCYSFSARQVTALKLGKQVEWEAYVPREAPPDLEHNLPAVSNQLSNELDLRAKLLAVTLTLESHGRWRSALAHLRTTNPFEAQILERQKTRIDHAERVLSDSARDVLKQLNAHAVAAESDTAFRKVIEFLERLSPRSGSPAREPTSRIDVEELLSIQGAVDELLCPMSR